jgi:hypothetical protein
MNVEVGTVAAQFTEKEYINGILVTVYFFIFSTQLYFPSVIKSS